jgi:hypothetical protein
MEIFIALGFVIVGLQVLILVAIESLKVKSPGEKADWDNTVDPPGGFSNLWVLTDHATGHQYLTTIAGGLTPRKPKSLAGDERE